MSYKLYLDDERIPKENDFVIARTYEEACNIVSEKGLPSFISFDYWLQERYTGLDFAIWVIMYCLRENIEPSFKFKSHSADKVNGRKITEFLNKRIKKENI